MLRLILILSVLSIATWPANYARADDAVGRYQMVPLPLHPGSFDTRIMILDTRDGHLWQWVDAPAIGSNLGARSTSGITYLGKVTPGDAPKK